MSDIADQANDITEAFTREALYLHSQRASQAQLEEVVCEHCEENPVKITAVGLKLKYCTRCIGELELKDV